MSHMAQRVGWFLLGINILLVVIYLSPLVDSPTSKFNMDAELGFPAWFTQTLLFSAAALAAFISHTKISSRHRDHLAFVGMAAVLLYLSIDEGVALHEMIALPVREAFSITSGPWIFAWTIPALVIVPLVGLFFLRFFLRLPRRHQVLLGLAASTYIFGALGLEIVAGFYWSEQNFVFDEVYRALTAAEEGLENTGVILTICALTDMLAIKTKPAYAKS
jgi:hypothetical protein